MPHAGPKSLEKDNRQVDHVFLLSTRIVQWFDADPLAAVLPGHGRGLRRAICEASP
jgi:hypothetical protein